MAYIKAVQRYANNIHVAILRNEYNTGNGSLFKVRLLKGLCPYVYYPYGRTATK